MLFTVFVTDVSNAAFSWHLYFRCCITIIIISIGRGVISLCWFPVQLQYTLCFAPYDICQSYLITVLYTRLIEANQYVSAMLLMWITR